MFKLDFRMFDEVSNTMLYSVDFEIEKDKIIYWFDKMNKDFDMEEIMLYSSLKDDAGLKIYDGDIVEVHNERESTNSYLSVVTVDPLYGTTITPHPKLQKRGITYPVPLTDYINEQRNVKCFKVGNVCTYPDLLDKIDQQLEETLYDTSDDHNIDIYYEKHRKYQERYK